MWGNPHPHDDVNAIRFYPVNGFMQLLMCTDGGLATTPTSFLAAGATTWTSGYNKRLTNLQVQTLGSGGYAGFFGCMSVDNYSSGPINRGYLVAAGTQDNAVLTCLMHPSGLGFWTQTSNSGDGQFCA